METEERTVSFDSKLTPEDMFEFHISHAFSTSQGWIAVIFGVVGILAGIVTFGRIELFYSVAYIVLGIIFLIYLPLIFRRRARVQVEGSEVLRNVLHYTFSSEGVGVRTDVPAAADGDMDVPAAEAGGDADEPAAVPKESMGAAADGDTEAQAAAHQELSGASAALESPSPQEALLPWDLVYKVTGTKHELLIYSSRTNAYVIPLRDMAGKEAALREVLQAHLPAHRMKWK